MKFSDTPELVCLSLFSPIYIEKVLSKLLWNNIVSLHFLCELTSRNVAFNFQSAGDSTIQYAWFQPAVSGCKGPKMPLHSTSPEMCR